MENYFSAVSNFSAISAIFANRCKAGMTCRMRVRPPKQYLTHKQVVTKSDICWLKIHLFSVIISNKILIIVKSELGL